MIPIYTQTNPSNGLYASAFVLFRWNPSKSGKYVMRVKITDMDDSQPADTTFNYILYQTDLADLTERGIMVESSRIFWIDQDDHIHPHTVDFDAPNVETSNLNTAPWTTLSGLPTIIAGSGTNTSNVLKLDSEEQVKMDIPVASQHATGTLEFDAYIPTGGGVLVQVLTSVGWVFANLYISYGWATQPDVCDHIGTGANAVASVVNFNEWGTWKLEWFGNSKTMSLTVDGVAVWTDIDWTEKDSGHPGGPVTQLKFFAWNGREVQIDNIVISQYQGTETIRTMIADTTGRPVTWKPGSMYNESMIFYTGEFYARVDELIALKVTSSNSADDGDTPNTCASIVEIYPADNINYISDNVPADSADIFEASTGEPGYGSVAHIYNVTSAGLPLANVYVVATTDAAGLNKVAKGYTDVFGNITFNLDPGSCYFTKYLAGYAGGVDIEVVV